MIRNILKKGSIENKFSFLRLVIAILLALLVAFFLICTISDTPFTDFKILLVGPLSNTSRIISIINKFIPLLFTGTAVCLVFSCGQITVACEGAFFAGAISATVVAMIHGIPSYIHIPLCLLAGGITGAVVVAIPSWMNMRYNVLTIVAALMINSVCLYLGLYLISNPLRDPTADYEASYKFADSAHLPSLFGIARIHLGLILGLIAVLIGYLLLFKTPQGIAIRTVGHNQNFAKYSGMNISKTVLLASLTAGLFAGIGGTTEILGNYDRFVYAGLTGHGWSGIVIAVLCHNNPKYVPIAALFLAYLSTSADSLNFSSRIPPEIINIIQPIIIIFVAAECFLAGWEHKAIVRSSEKALSNENGGAR